MARNDPRLLKGVAVVTGAGSGLGRALSLELIGRGVTVFGLGCSQSTLQATADLAGESFVSKLVDVSDFAAVQRAFDEIGQSHGVPSLLINNAAIYPRVDLFDDSPDHFMQTVRVNLGGVVACTQAALSGMAQLGFGRVMNVATFADVMPIPASAAYSVSKGAARIYTRAVLADIADRFPDIVVNDWMPGMLATRMGVADGLDPALAAQWGVEMALWHDPSLNGATFEMNREILPPRGMKRRIKDLLTGKRPKPRLL